LCCNTSIQEPILIEDCIDTENSSQIQDPLLRNNEDSQDQNPNIKGKVENIVQQKRHCPAKRNNDFLWN